MARPKKNEEANVEQAVQIIADVVETEAKAQSSEKTEPEKSTEPSAKVLNLMRLNPQYEEIWVTPHGFVHPKNAPKYCTAGATLYKNKYYKTK